MIQMIFARAAKWGALALAAALVSGCATTTTADLAGSERKQLLLVPEATVLQDANRAYADTRREAASANRLVTSGREYTRLVRIKNRILRNIDALRPGASAWQWELTLIDSPRIEATVLPGGKMIVYTGLIRELKLTDDEIAAIMGHEIAHALREHVREKLSQRQMTGIVTRVIGDVAGVRPDLLDPLTKPNNDVPFSREMEDEADAYGLELTAHAGYHPGAAITALEKIRGVGNGQSPKGRHPPDLARVETLTALQERVMPIYERVRSLPIIDQISLSESTGRPRPDHERAFDDPSAETTHYGLPDDAITLETDRLLALLSFTVYASPEKIKAVERNLQTLEQKFDRISADPARIDGVRQKELQKLGAKIEATTRKLEMLDFMMALKAGIPAAFGAHMIPVQKIDKIHYERYRLRDGREVLVFRGTDGLQDLETDIQLAITPEAVKELAAMGGATQPLLHRIAEYMQKESNVETTGRPEALRSADRLVASVIKRGIPSNKLILTGHSLGGGLAQYAGIKNNVRTVVTFNAAPLNEQLRSDIALQYAQYDGDLRHYVSFLPGEMGKEGVLDPISQGFARFTGRHENSALQVLGKQFVINVCNDIGSPAYRSFYNTANGIVSSGTLLALSSGHSNLIRTVSVAGAVAGGRHATTDRVSSATTGGLMVGKRARVAVALANCRRHPFMCSAKLVAGGLASAAVAATVPKVWTLYNAHRMKNLAEAMHSDENLACEYSSNTASAAM